MMNLLFHSHHLINLPSRLLADIFESNLSVLMQACHPACMHSRALKAPDELSSFPVPVGGGTSISVKSVASGNPPAAHQPSSKAGPKVITQPPSKAGPKVITQPVHVLSSVSRGHHPPVVPSEPLPLTVKTSQSWPSFSKCHSLASCTHLIWHCILDYMSIINPR